MLSTKDKPGEHDRTDQLSVGRKISAYKKTFP